MRFRTVALPPRMSVTSAGFESWLKPPVFTRASETRSGMLSR